jgi:nucleoside 2-deoxyribosyltransferase
MNARPRIYLAGPGVFRPDADAYGRGLVELCALHGLEGLWPGSEAPTAYKIFEANLKLIDSAAAVVADITPFRGPHCDPGTAWELGYAFRAGIPVVAWSGRTGELRQRFGTWFARTDSEGNMVEDFGLPENLMVVLGAVSIESSIDAAIVKVADVLRARSSRR